MDAIKDKANQAGNYLSGKGGEAKHEAGQQQAESGAKDSSKPLTERAGDAVNYVTEGAKKEDNKAQAGANKPI